MPEVEHAGRNARERIVLPPSALFRLPETVPTRIRASQVRSSQVAFNK